jgi:HD-like signal output (HDOD) protein
VLEYSERANIGLYAAERELLGCSHAQVAAYLLGVWGLPGTIVEAVAWHHQPEESLSTKFSPLAAVHVASAYHDEKSSSRLRDRTPIDSAFLARIGCTDRDKPWRSKLEADRQSPRSDHE